MVTKFARAMPAIRRLKISGPSPLGDLIVRVLLEPACATSLTPSDWDLLVRQGRRTYLLARLAITLRDAGVFESAPMAARQHFLAAQVMVDRQSTALQWEVRCLLKELRDAGAKVTLLKGAAYAIERLDAASGRVFSDIDILVPKARIPYVESELMIHGWQGNHKDAYDERYYRQWMHEIPPMRHVSRRVTIDVHHAILPETARIKVDTPALIGAIRPSRHHPGVWVLAPVDMVLHSATHLFHEGELDKGLRDLFDLACLMREFEQSEDDFWESLTPRAQQLGLVRPLFYALRYCKGLLKVPVPADAMAAASHAGAPSNMLLSLMDWCYLRALRPSHSSCDTASTWLARFALFLRSHWIRMPTHLLVVHLARKAWKRWTEPAEKPKAIADARTADTTGERTEA